MRVGSPCSSVPDRGQVVPLLLVVLAAAAAAALLVVEVVRAAAEDARGQTAADAAALAGAADGPGAAAELARANGGEVVGYTTTEGQGGTTVGVTVAHGRATARASAEALGATASSAPFARSGLAPAMVAALARAEQLLGWTVPAVPTDATGLRIEVTSDVGAAVQSVAEQAGLCQPSPQDHPVHFEPCPPTRP